jgi:2-methylcitrate dehydratase
LSNFIDLPAETNQARGIAQYAIDFVAGKFSPGPSQRVWRTLERFHIDSVACGVSALAAGCNAPTVLRNEALEYRSGPNAEPSPQEDACHEPSRMDRVRGQREFGCFCFGSRVPVKPEKAVVANCSAVREWDSNGTNFGYDPARGHIAGEFGHNDFYPVAIAAAQQCGLDGCAAMRGMLAIDEIRGRLAEVFSLKSYKIDHVVHGTIASAAVYGAMSGATVDQIESAIGLVVAHYIPFRAIRHGKQLSDSKGASAAISAEMAVLSAERALRGFVGPVDIFRNPEAIFCLFEKPSKSGSSPFDLSLATGGDDFAVMGMHLKLGLYEHQSAGAIQGLIDLLCRQPRLLENPPALRSVRISIYEPALHIIGDPAKRDPRTRQSADHSLVYIIATLLRKAIEQKRTGWKDLMLLPADYDDTALFHPLTRQLMEKIEFRHGGPEYDAKYPDGIPTTIEIDHAELGPQSSGLVMYPLGHARNHSAELDDVLDFKFRSLASMAVEKPEELRRRFANLQQKSADEIVSLCDFPIRGVE